jgi:hypothetical protein
VADRRAFCSDVSAESAEPVAGTASRVDRWILVEYRGVWGRDALAGSGLSEEVKRHLGKRLRALRPAKLLFVRSRDRGRQAPLRVFWGCSRPGEARLSTADIGSYAELLKLDFVARGDELAHPLLLVCTHGKHDLCCARYGRPLYEALREQADDHWVWQSTHLGGDRFAGNLIVLPEGLYFGRVSATDAWRVLDSYLDRRIELDRFRGRCCHSFAVQAAEHEVRLAAGVTGIDAVEVRSRRDRVVTLRAGERLYEVEVERVPGELSYLTCAAETLTRPRRYVARILRESDA